ncbi:hypothetical protein IMZ48_22310 [Candidatus Bathyarchaeota archaeon]|nr:hypothetical protein [Candidatus Bathyarchaeota archaeon]
MASQNQSPSGRAAFKKKDGVLALSPDQRSILWTPAPGNGPPTITLPVENISSMLVPPPRATTHPKT